MTSLDADAVYASLRDLDVWLADDYGMSDVWPMTIVGGAALMLHGALPASHVTQDIDVIASDIPESMLASLGMSSAADTFAYQLPDGWEGRTVPYRPDDFDVLEPSLLSVPDLVVSKLVAGREKDVSDVREAIVSGMADTDEVHALMDRTSLLGVDDDRYDRAQELLEEVTSDDVRGVAEAGPGPDAGPGTDAGDAGLEPA